MRLRDSDEEMERENNPACRDYSGKNLEIVAWHKGDAVEEWHSSKLVGIQRTHGPLKEMPTTTRRMYVKPPKFDGEGCIESQLMQFKIAASRNGWTDEGKLEFLIISLTGDASYVLKDLDEYISYEALVAKLKQRFGILEHQDVFRIQLKGRRRRGKMCETLTDLMKDIRRLFMLVYSGQYTTMADAIAKDAFIDVLGYKELTIRGMWREPESLEAFKISEKTELCARKVKPEGKDGFESKINDLVEPGYLFQVYCQDCYKLLVIINFASFMYFSSIMKTIQ